MCKIEKTVEYYNNYIDKNDAPPLLIDAIHFLNNNLSHINKSVYGIILYDFNDKHIVIKQGKGKWNLSAFVDLEQTCFGYLYIDIAWLYINTLLDDKELEKSFWAGYEPEHLNFDDHTICFFLVYFGMELCTVLRRINVNHYNWGLSIIEKTFNRYHSL